MVSFAPKIETDLFEDPESFRFVGVRKQRNAWLKMLIEERNKASFPFENSREILVRFFRSRKSFPARLQRFDISARSV
jgi:hypothetical protein